jgi:hypothetical protein
MRYEEVNKALSVEFPDFHMHDDDYRLPYVVAGNYVRYLLDLYTNDEQEIYKRGLRFVEKLNLSSCDKVRELATVGYLESFLNWPYKDDSLNEFEPES